MNYLDRPVFPFTPDWGSAPAEKTFAYDLRALALGFGAEVFSPLQSNAVQGFQFDVRLNTAAEIDAFDDFFAALTGRLTGFWLPAPLLALQIVAPVAATKFDIAGQDLRGTFADHPDVYLYFDTGAVQQCARITGVALNEDGTERVTVDAALDPAPSPAMAVWRLHYVRLAGDDEKGSFVLENSMARTVSVVELPEEYAAVETGVLKIHLYHFWADAPMDWHWYYTSFAAPVASGGIVYQPFAMSHGEITDSTNPDDMTLDITAAFDPAHPFALFLPIPFSRPLNVSVSRCTYTAPDTVRQLFRGVVRSVPDADDKLTAKCDGWVRAFGKKFPRAWIAPDCSNTLFDRGCKIVRAAYETTAVIVAVDATVQPATVTVDLAYPAASKFSRWITEDWFAQGFLETGLGREFEVRSITASVPDEDAPGRLVLTVNAPLFKAQAGQRLQLIAGCDGTAATCTAKFGNFVNFFGFPNVPDRNLTMKAINANVSAGGKK